MFLLIFHDLNIINFEIILWEMKQGVFMQVTGSKLNQQQTNVNTLNNADNTKKNKRAKTDKSLNGLKTLCKRGDQLALEKVDAIIRNTYKTLLSRAMKGCFVYCTDSALSIYLKERIRENKELMESFKKSIKLG